VFRSADPFETEGGDLSQRRGRAQKGNASSLLKLDTRNHNREQEIPSSEREERQGRKGGKIRERKTNEAEA